VVGGGRRTGQAARGWRGCCDHCVRGPLGGSLGKWKEMSWGGIGVEGGGRGIGEANGRSVHSDRSPVGAAERKEIAGVEDPEGRERKALGLEVEGGDETRQSPPGYPPPEEWPSGLGPSCAPGGRRVEAEDQVAGEVDEGGHGLRKGACLMAEEGHLCERGWVAPTG